MQHNEALQQTGVNEGLYKGTHLVLFLMSHLSQLAYGRDGKGGMKNMGGGAEKRVLCSKVVKDRKQTAENEQSVKSGCKFTAKER